MREFNFVNRSSFFMSMLLLDCYRYSAGRPRMLWFHRPELPA
ncbi:hypothetical protein RISK_003236 [Rhodopirellula islandica]|uniref:Uncharacterized protein n=1 Tax=Rhodopirellula islandica TaxID=595434 RepID=A0A0J1EGE5_RHOIS|nr:hypothetical protein RISK_003236 [Rhodopirellula islandica]